MSKTRPRIGQNKPREAERKLYAALWRDIGCAETSTEDRRKKIKASFDRARRWYYEREFPDMVDTAMACLDQDKDPFDQHLSDLYDITLDITFVKAISKREELINAGFKMPKFTVAKHKTDIDRLRPHTTAELAICLRLDELIEVNTSKKAALEQLTYELCFPANSFDAAVKSVERLVCDAETRRDKLWTWRRTKHQKEP